MTSDALEPFRFTGFLIRRAQQAHVVVWSREVSAEVTSVQYGVLAVLDRIPGASQRQLCDELDLDRSTIAALVHRLEKRGVIERERSAGDRRRNTLRLTEAGTSELRLLGPRVEQVERALTADLTASEIEALRALLGKVLTSAGTPVLDGSSATD